MLLFSRSSLHSFIASTPLFTNKSPKHDHDCGTCTDLVREVCTSQLTKLSSVTNNWSWPRISGDYIDSMTDSLLKLTYYFTWLNVFVNKLSLHCVT